MNSISRISFWDNVKALGIISIVLGHFCLIEDVALFAYSYHLVIFFFVAGALFNRDKYSRHPIKFALIKMRSLYLPYVCYMTFFTVIHNLTSPDKYTASKTALQALKNLVFSGSESMGGALWFVPFMLMGMFAFCGISFICSALPSKLSRVVEIALCLAAGILGLIIISNKIKTPFHINLCMIVLPIILVGNLLRNQLSAPEKIFRWWGAIICAAYLVWTSNIRRFRVDFSHDLIGTPERFYLISFCGIYLMCTLAVYISKSRILSRFFSFIGRYSFDIMALQFLFAFCVKKLFAFLGFTSIFANHAEWIIITVSSLVLSPFIRLFCSKIKSFIQQTVKPKNTVM